MRHVHTPNLLSFVAALMLILFALQLSGTIRMDGNAIALLVLALSPSASLPARGILFDR